MRAGWLLLLAAACPLWAQDERAYTFGTTVVDLSGFQGRVFYLKPGTQKLPNFDHLDPVGSVYTNTLNVWPQHFTEGFPNISDRYEWFGIEYMGKIWIEKAGVYRFSLLSDDGATLRVDDKMVLNNDGMHAAMAVSGGATLTRGAHDVRVDYFQGPRLTVALVLAVAPPGEGWRIFDTTDFKPPKDPAEWQKGKISQIQRQTEMRQ